MNTTKPHTTIPVFVYLYRSDTNPIIYTFLPIPGDRSIRSQMMLSEFSLISDTYA